MAIMVTDTVLNKTAIACAIALVTVNTVSAGEFIFEPSIKLSETYSDNVELTTNNTDSSFVSQLALIIDASYEAQYANFNITSNSTYATFTHDHSLDNDFHDVEASFDVMLWPNGVTLFGQSKIDNQARNGSRNALADIVSSDTVQVEDYNAGLRYDVTNSNFIIQSAASYILTKSDDGIGEKEGYQLSFSSKNGSAQRHVFWRTDGNFQDLENNGNDARFYSGEVRFGWLTSFDFHPFLRYFDEDNQGTIRNDSQSLESNSYGLGIRWQVTPRLILDLSYNKPIGSQTDFDGNPQSNYADIQINWQPSSRTQLSAGISQRFYGDSYNFDFKHKIKRVENEISYVEEVKAFTRNNFEQFLVGYFWCPTTDEIELNNCFIQNDQNINFDDYQLVTINDFNVIEDQEYSLNKSLSWTSTLALARTSFSITASDLKRTNLTTKSKDKNGAVSFKIDRKISGKSNLSFDASYTEVQQRIGEVSERFDRYRKYTIEYKKTINSSLETKFGVSSLNRDSDFDLYNSDEERVYLEFTKEF